jgi:hypothetical protein
MYRLLTITFAFAVFFGLTQAAPIPKDGDKPQFCFPTTVGTEVVQRHFRVNGKNEFLLARQQLYSPSEFALTC